MHKASITLQLLTMATSSRRSYLHASLSAILPIYMLILQFISLMLSPILNNHLFNHTLIHVKTPYEEPFLYITFVLQISRLLTHVSCTTLYSFVCVRVLEGVRDLYGFPSLLPPSWIYAYYIRHKRMVAVVVIIRFFMVYCLLLLNSVTWVY